jgi:uncharacterized protein
MAARTDSFDLSALRLTAGEGRRLELACGQAPLTLSGQPYTVAPADVPVTLDVSRMSGGGYALRLRFSVSVEGACMRCLADAAPEIAVDAREVDAPGGGEDLDSPYVAEGVVDLRGWVRDALALALPAQVVCRPDCAGLCAHCGADLNEAGPEHHHEPAPDPRWAKLRELQAE